MGIYALEGPEDFQQQQTHTQQQVVLSEVDSNCSKGFKLSWVSADISNQAWLRNGCSAPREAALPPCFCPFLNAATACFVLAVQFIEVLLLGGGEHAGFLIRLLAC